MVQRLNPHKKKIILFILLVFFAAAYSTYSFALTESERTFLNDLARDTFQYIRSDWATDNHLPWSWRSERDDLNGSYANVTEIGLYMLSYIGAYEMRQPWSPTRREVKDELLAVLNQLLEWQNNETDVVCSLDVSRENAYRPNNDPTIKVFYQWYWVTTTPPHISCNLDPDSTDEVVPSVDNAFLAASLMTVREWAETQGINVLRNRADNILKGLNFQIWFNNTTKRFTWGDVNDPTGGGEADVYSNENRIINFVARALKQLSKRKFLDSLKALTKTPGTYEDITVRAMNYDGAIFTYFMPGLFINERSTNYYNNTLKRVIQAQMAYAADKGYEAWGLSDCYDMDEPSPAPLGNYMTLQGAPPGMATPPLEIREGLIAPYASGMTLRSKFTSAAITNLQTLKAIDGVYPLNHVGTTTPVYYGFRDCVVAWPDSPDNHKVSARYSALAQEFIFLTIAQRQTNFITNAFYGYPGVQRAHNEMFAVPTPVETPELLPLRAGN